MEQSRTAIVPIRLTGAAYRQAHTACHQAAALWNGEQVPPEKTGGVHTSE